MNHRDTETQDRTEEYLEPGPHSSNHIAGHFNKLSVRVAGRSVPSVPLWFAGNTPLEERLK